MSNIYFYYIALITLQNSLLEKKLYSYSNTTFILLTQIVIFFFMLVQLVRFFYVYYSFLVATLAKDLIYSLYKQEVNQLYYFSTTRFYILVSIEEKLIRMSITLQIYV